MGLGLKIPIILWQSLNFSLSFTPNISFANSAFQYPATLIDGTRLLIGTVLVTFITNCISNAENLWAMRGGDGDGGDNHTCSCRHVTWFIRHYIANIYFTFGLFCNIISHSSCFIKYEKYLEEAGNCSVRVILFSTFNWETKISVVS